MRRGQGGIKMPRFGAALRDEVDLYHEIYWFMRRSDWLHAWTADYLAGMTGQSRAAVVDVLNAYSPPFMYVPRALAWRLEDSEYASTDE